MKILFVGDIVGKPGRSLTRTGVPALVAHHGIDLVIANVENAAGGNGITREIGETFRDQGIQVMTSGNHVWDKREALDYIGLEPRLIRPANYPDGVPGYGHVVTTTTANESVAVINVMGRVFMAPLDNPFVVIDRE
ncbi:MAG: YmdB family metallophosphoesterase, partial [Acidobacteriota bacterium]|nr:YmdB family metallophosphoesterase [Acidobacteriota bacterium]